MNRVDSQGEAAGGRLFAQGDHDRPRGRDRGDVGRRDALAALLAVGLAKRVVDLDGCPVLEHDHAGAAHAGRQARAASSKQSSRICGSWETSLYYAAAAHRGLRSGSCLLPAANCLTSFPAFLELSHTDQPTEEATDECTVENVPGRLRPVRGRGRSPRPYHRQPHPAQNSRFHRRRRRQFQDQGDHDRAGAERPQPCPAGSPRRR